MTTAAVQSFTLINAATDTPIAGYDPIPNNAVVDLASFPSITIRANVTGTVGSVRFGLDSLSSYHLENLAPYAIAADNGGDYVPWSAPLGSHTVQATTYSGANLTGEMSPTVSLQISFVNSGQGGEAPYPPSPVITSMQIEPQRISIGNGDNFPLTWGSDDNIYTAYADGTGFGSQVKSNGQARIFGTPPNISGSNINSPTGEAPPGDGPAGRKASGLLMSNGVLYQWLRNLHSNGTGSSLGWSSDFANTWTWADSSWTMPHLGYPTWLNAGRNYQAAQDGYAYFYSPDGPSAYEAYPGLLLGRVPTHSITNPSAYQYYAGTDGSGQPIWTSNFAQHRPVFTNNVDGVFRASVVYNPGLGRYLLTTTNAYSAGTNYLGVFDSPTPWGPWTTVAYIKGWGKPSETRFQPQIPSKWISADGLSFYLQYSCYPTGPYQFNVQRVVLTASATPPPPPPPPPPATTNPIAAWKMDDGAGFTASDSSGQGNHGALMNGVAWTSGKAGTALSFNNTTNYVVVNNAPSLEVGKNGSDFTVEYWIYLQQGPSGSWRSIMHKGNANSAERTFAMWLFPDSNRIHYRISTTVDSNEGGNTVSEIPVNAWTHIAYVKGSNTVKFYINGVLDSQANLRAPTVSNTGPIHLGRHQDPWYSVFTGKLDEVHLYNRAISESEVVSLANGGSLANRAPVVSASASASPTQASVGQPVTFAVSATDADNDPLSYAWNFGDSATASGATASHAFAAPGTYTATVSISDGRGGTASSTVNVTIVAAAPTGKVGHWAMDNGSGATATDSSGNGNHGTLMNGTTWTTGKVGSALNFTGSSNVTINNAPVLQVGANGADFSLGFWVYLTGGPNGQWRSLARKGNSDSDRTFAMWLSPTDNRIHYCISTSGYWNEGEMSSADLPMNTWTHVTYVKAGNVVKLYVNGVKDSQRALLGASIGNNGPISFGDDPWYAGINGKLDEVQLYNHALSDSQVAALVGDSGPIAHWAMENGSGATATDSSGNGNHGTLMSGTTWTSGKVGSALNFTGSSNLTINNAPILQVGANGADFSLGFWVYLTGGPNGQWRSLARKGNSDSDRTFAMWLSPTDNRIHYCISTSGYWNEGEMSAANLPLNAWTHVAYVKAGNALKLYVNGVEDSQRTLLGPSIGNNGPISFGDDPWYAGINGKLDEIKLYNRALSGSEVAAMAGDSGPIAQWSMDNGSGPTATDSSGNGNHGTLMSGTTWTTGKVGGALNFTGSSNLTINNAPVLQVGANGSDFSLGFWVYLTGGPNGQWRSLARKGNSDTDRTFAMWLSPTDNRIHYCISTSGFWNEGEMSAANLPLNAWTHVAYVKAGNALKLYVNGVEDSQRTLLGPSITNNGPISFGDDPWYAGISGKLDEIKLYNRALTGAEVSSLAR